MEILNSILRPLNKNKKTSQSNNTTWNSDTCAEPAEVMSEPTIFRNNERKGLLEMKIKDWKKRFNTS